MRISEFWERVHAELAAARPVYACLVVDQQKGSPGTKAARLLLTADGRQYGTIGGGIMEKDVIESATKLLAHSRSPVFELEGVVHRPTAEGAESGLICGGAQTNLRIIFRPDRHLNVVGEIARAAKKETHAAVCITAGKIEKVGVEGPWAGDEVDLVDGDSKEWRVLVYLRNQRRMAVFGGGHCGAALARLMNELGYAVSLIDPRKDVLCSSKTPRSVRRINRAFEAGASRVAHAGDTHAVIMTYSMVSDVEALAGALTHGFKSIGVMGSRVKIARIRSRLLEKGFSRLQVDSIRAPIGLSFNSDTPMEIAVSVAAKVLLDREENKNGEV